MRKFVKASAAALALVLLLGACSKSGNQGGTGTEGSKEASKDSNAVYTYNDYTAATPNTMNPHTQQQSNDSYLDSYLQTPLITAIPDGEGGYKWEYMGATSIEDVTKDFADKEKWGIPAEADKGLVWKITLREDQKWSDGTPIDANTHVYSMSQLLNPEMKNRRANTYYSGSLAIRGAEEYYTYDKNYKGKAKYSAWSADTPEDAKLFFTVEKVEEAFTPDSGFFGADLATAYENYGAEAFTVDGVDVYKKYQGQGLVEVTAEVQKDLEGLAVNFENPAENWKEFTYFEDGTYEEVTFDSVGFYKGENDYEYYHILQNPATEFIFFANSTGSWLVKEDLYEAGKNQKEGLLATNYATDLATAYSYGPYKLVSLEKDRQMKLERNEEWYGYKLDTDQFKDQFVADKITIEIIEDPNTALQLFNKGQLDNVNLDADQWQRYRMSEYMHTAEESYTFRYVFGTSPETLAQLEANAGDGSNKRVLQYKDFRKALSLSLDRNKITSESTAGNAPAYYLLNNNYYYDIENDPQSIYRKSEAAMEAIVDLYGVEYGDGKSYATAEDAYNALSGYDVESAKKLFQAAYDQAIADGNYTDGQAVNINIMVGPASSLTAQDTRQQDIVNELLQQATEGTGFAGKVNVKYLTGSTSRYDDVVNGKVEAIRGAWGGGAFYPFSSIGVYVNPASTGGLNKIHESNGWNPTVAQLKLKFDFNGDGTEEEETRTLTEWQSAIQGIEFNDNVEAKLYILAQLEKAVLDTVQNIPLYTSTFNMMTSQKVSQYTNVYNPMYGFGGFRFLKFHYSDADWAKYVEEQGGILNYE